MLGWGHSNHHLVGLRLPHELIAKQHVLFRFHLGHTLADAPPGQPGGTGFGGEALPVPPSLVVKPAPSVPTPGEHAIFSRLLIQIVLPPPNIMIHVSH